MDVDGGEVTIRSLKERGFVCRRRPQHDNLFIRPILHQYFIQWPLLNGVRSWRAMIVSAFPVCILLNSHLPYSYAVKSETDTGNTRIFRPGFAPRLNPDHPLAIIAEQCDRSRNIVSGSVSPWLSSYAKLHFLLRNGRLLCVPVDPFRPGFLWTPATNRDRDETRVHSRDYHCMVHNKGETCP
jgi:hypothetical protein